MNDKFKGHYFTNLLEPLKVDDSELETFVRRIFKAMKFFLNSDGDSTQISDAKIHLQGEKQHRIPDAMGRYGFNLQEFEIAEQLLGETSYYEEIIMRTKGGLLPIHLKEINASLYSSIEKQKIHGTSSKANLNKLCDKETQTEGSFKTNVQTSPNKGKKEKTLEEEEIELLKQAN